MQRDEPANSVRSNLLRDGAITLAAVVLVVLALDDITTDDAPNFAFERTAILACGVWFGVACWRLLRRGHHLLAGVSLAWLVLGAEAQPAIGQGSVTRFAQVATAGALLWFVLLAGILVWQAWRLGGRRTA